MLKRTTSPRPGFTLVEILVVVVILGIAGAIIVPQLGTRDDRKVESAARVIIADLIYAQNLAITSQDLRYVAFDVTGSPRRYSVTDQAMNILKHPVEKTTYTIRFGAGGTHGMDEITLVSADFSNQAGVAYHTMGYDELGAPMVYTDTGTTETMHAGSIVLQCGTFKIRIDIEPYTGQIKVTNI
jgi:prepilin-type N-terminal cleavage/methylation domain-containing protein